MRNLRKIFSGALTALLLTGAVLFSGCGGKAVQTQAEDGVLNPAKALAAVTAVQSGGAPLLEEGTRPSDEQLKDIYLIDTTLLEESLIVIDKNNAFCMALRPVQGKTNEVKNMMSAALNSLSTQLELYTLEQSERVKNRLETVRGEYLIYIASADNNALLDAVDSANG